MSKSVDQTPHRAEIGGTAEEQLLRAFFAMHKTARIIEENNETFSRQLDTLLEHLSTIARHSGDVIIKAVADRYFVNDKVVVIDDRDNCGAPQVVAEWRRLGLGGVRLLPEIARKEISGFFTFVAGINPNDDNTEELCVQLKSYKLPNLQLLSIKEVAPKQPQVSEEVRRQFRTMARKTFFQAMTVVQEAVTNTAEDRDINVAKTKRVVHSLIDHIVRDEYSLLELTSIKNFDDYTYAHCTNVCVYSLTLGVRLGMDRPRLSQLGFAALFHDIGKVKLPSDLIRKPEAYDEGDWIQMQRHPALGAKTVLRNLKLSAHTARAARVALEHHINSDFTGYPLLRHDRRASNLFSRIVSIVDTFDALTSGRVYLRQSMSPDVVLKKMRYQMNVKFDAFLLKLFTNVVGVFPAGSLVLLNTDELALVLTNNDDDRSRPVVKIVGDKSGLFEETVWVDLSNPEHRHRSILRMVEPERYGLDIKDFVLRD